MAILTVRGVVAAFLDQKEADGNWDVSRNVFGATLLICQKNVNTEKDVTVAEIKDGILTLFPPPFKKGSGWARALNRYNDILGFLANGSVGRFQNRYEVYLGPRRFVKRRLKPDPPTMFLTNPTKFNLVALKMGASFKASCLT